MISILIPSIRPKELRLLLHDIENNTVQPDHVFVIDNSEEKIPFRDYSFNLHVYRFNVNVGPVWTWNLAFKFPCIFPTEYICIMNDRIRVEKYMLEKFSRVLDNNKEVKVVCPTINLTKPFSETNGNDLVFDSIKWTKGNCAVFMFRKQYAIDTPSIPSELFIYFNDNWLGLFTQPGEWVKLRNCFVKYDPGQKSESYIKWCRKMIRKERPIYTSFARKIVGDRKNEGSVFIHV